MPSFARASWKASLQLPKGAVRVWRSPSPPAFFGADVVVVGGLDFAYRAHAVRAKGAVAWTFDSGIRETHGALTKPAVVVGGGEDLLALAVVDGIAFVDASGIERSRAVLGARPCKAPAPAEIAGKRALIVPLVDGRVVAIDLAAKHATLWSTMLPTRPTSPLSLMNEGRLAIGLMWDGTAYAVDVDVEVDGGAVRWARKTGQSVTDGVAIAVVEDGCLALFPTGDGASLVALDGASGEVRWKYAAGHLVFGTTCVTGGVALCTSMYGRGGDRLHGVDVASGKRRFVIEGGYGGGLELAVCAGRAYACLGNELFVVDAATGEELARGKLAHEPKAPPLVEEKSGAVFIATSHDLVAYGVKK